MQNTLGKNMITKQTVMENCILIMETFYKDSSRTADAKEKEDGSSPMEAIMKVTLKIMLLMDMESILTSMDTNMKVNGKIIFQMEKEKLNTQMEVDTTDNFLTIKDMVKEF